MGPGIDMAVTASLVAAVAKIDLQAFQPGASEGWQAIDHSRGQPERHKITPSVKRFHDFAPEKRV